MPIEPSSAPAPHGHLMPPTGDLWVFGYGSLMWDPGFDHLAAGKAQLHGYHRAFCMYSERHRGTAARPGLVLALDRGGSCQGIAYRVARDKADDVLAYLWEREMPRYAYLPRQLRASVGDRRVTCVTFIVDRSQKSYAGRLSPERTAAIIDGATGERGTNRDYLINTVRHLEELGIADGTIHDVLKIVNGR